MSKLLSRNIFDALGGTWNLRRTILSKLPTSPSGRVTGTATLLPYSWPPHPTFLYSEVGEFKTKSGQVLQAYKKYLYHYDEGNVPDWERVSVWYVKEARDNNNGNSQKVEPGSLLHRLDHEGLLVDDGEPDMVGEPVSGSWTATASHECGKDQYDATYDFNFKGGELRDWRLQYTVKGPEKDYSTDTWFSQGDRGLGSS
ncbi:hypothetical protein DRE_07382 [Drechslerella stenobrocha 248]|uniref:DUF6314 domain-containing protein n=1 Tax=Drechslerella stenobrocha 248 TaxID=1043628 RepID=W7HL50_9PEZI|nr:hypothetical protein DRE_07382 [Drechslerella stenobrocha 248]